MPEDPEHGDAELISDEEDDSVEDGVVQGRLSALLPRKLFADDAAVKKGLLQVYVRVKPVARKLARCMAIERDALVRATWKNKEALYKFSRVFPEDAPQEALYAGVARPMVSDLLSGKTPEGVIMAYGVTSAGKTFTMQGTPERPGLVPQALEHLFGGLPAAAAAAAAAAGDNGGKGAGPLRVVVSAYEIYNEVIYDLLGLAQAPIAPGGAARPALRLKEVKRGHITVQGATEAEVTSAKQALDLLRRAARARQSAGTALNQHSSRSHAVFTVKLLRGGGGAAAAAAAEEDGGAAAAAAAGGSSGSQRGPDGSQRGGGAGGGESEKGAGGGESEKGSDGGAAGESAGYLHFVDLAGCERVARTGNSGARLRESVAINSSLSTLSRCLEVLRYNQMHPADTKVIPYRESKITHMFREVLSGHGRFCLLVNVSPAEEEFNETKRVLEYAALASKIKMTSNLLDKSTASSAAAAAATAAAHQQGAEATALAAQVAALTARLAASDARIEELLDDVADLRYDLDVADRKVELLREELVRAEVEKEGLEAEVRAELMADVAALVKDAGAKAKEEAAKAKEEAARAREEAAKAREELAKARSGVAAAARDAGAKGRQDVAKAREEAAAARAAAAEAGQEAQRLAAEVAKLQQQLDEECREAERQRGAAQQAQHEAEQLRAQVGALQARGEPLAAAKAEEGSGKHMGVAPVAPPPQQPQQRRNGRQRGSKQQHSRGHEHEEVAAVCPAQAEQAAQQQVEQQQPSESEQQTSQQQQQQQQQQEPVVQPGEAKAADQRRKKASDGGRAGRSSAGDVGGADAEHPTGPAGGRTRHAAPAERAADHAAASSRSPEDEAPAAGARGGSIEAKAHKARQGRKVRIVHDAVAAGEGAAAAAAPSTEGAPADAAAAPGGSGPKRRAGRSAHAAAPARAGSEEGGAAEAEQWRPAAEALRELTASEQQRFASEAPRAVGRRATIAAVAGRPVAAHKGGNGGSAEGGAAAGCGGGRKRRCSWGAEEVAAAPAATAAPEGPAVGATPVARRTRGGRHPAAAKS